MSEKEGGRRGGTNVGEVGKKNSCEERKSEKKIGKGEERKIVKESKSGGEGW